jgi:hypothetical protein
MTQPFNRFFKKFSNRSILCLVADKGVKFWHHDTSYFSNPVGKDQKSLGLGNDSGKMDMIMALLYLSGEGVVNK